MPDYTFGIFNIAEFSWTGDAPFVDSDSYVATPGDSFTFSAVATGQSVTVQDTANAELTDKDTASTQTINFADPSQTITVENGTFGNGTQFESAWTYTVSGSDGSQISIWGVTFNDVDADVQAIVTTGKLQPGVTYTILSDPPPSFTSGIGYNTLICFDAATRLLTPQGSRQISDLRIGDLVTTVDQGAQPIRWITSRHLGALELLTRPKCRPIRLARGSLAPNVPHHDLLVSPLHRILLRSKILRNRTGHVEALAAAKHLTALPGIDIASDRMEVTFVHLLLDRHQIVIANGAESETLLRGQQVLPSLPAAFRTGAKDPARPILTGRKVREVAKAHLKRGQYLLSSEIDDSKATLC